MDRRFSITLWLEKGVWHNSYFLNDALSFFKFRGLFLEPFFPFKSDLPFNSTYHNNSTSYSVTIS